MQSGSEIESNSPEELRRYEALLEMADLIVRHHSLAELFAELFNDTAVRLRTVADFRFLNFSIHDPEHNLMHLHWWEGEPATGLPVNVPITESPSGWVWEHQQELLFRDLREEKGFPAVLDLMREHGMLTYLLEPLTTAESRLGALGIASSRVDAYGKQDRRLLRSVAELVAVAVENTLTREALQGEKRRLQALLDVNRTLASSLEMQRLLPLISECVTRVVPHDFAGVTLFEGNKDDMKAYVLSPAPSSSVVESGRQVSLDQTLSARALLESESKTLTHDDLASHPSGIAARVLGAGIRTVRCMPLLTSTGALGTLNVGSKRTKLFHPG
jgi:formate hydrogenlyase transcriptional activator